MTPDRAGPYAYGTLVTLTATPATDWHLASWSVESCPISSNTCVVTMYGDLGVSVTFEQNIQWFLTANIVGQGTVAKDPDQERYPYSTQVTLTATPALRLVLHHGTVTALVNPTRAF